MSLLAFQILGRVLSVDCHDELRDLLIANLAYFKCDAQNADLHYTVGRSDGESYFITAPRNSHTGVTKGLFLAMFERELTVDLQLQRPDLFFLHAAALQFEGKCVPGGGSIRHRKVDAGLGVSE